MRLWKDFLIISLFVIGSLFVASRSTGETISDRIFPEDLIENEEVSEEVPETEPEIFAYGIPMTDRFIEYHKVRPRQLLSDILVRNGISMQTIHDISLLPDSILDERKIKPGNQYAFIREADSTISWFIYEKDQTNYVTVQLNSAPVFAKNGRKPVTTRLKRASGTIEISLWEAMKDSDINPMLAVELSEIYAWSIDFFGLQQGDRFKVIYEESYVDSSSTGINEIKGAWFLHNNTEFWAIPFIQDSVRSFFDEQGNSLRKAFLKAPLRFSRISSGFSNSRFHPILKIYRPHHGIDYAAPAGTPVQTVGDGVVSKKGYESGGGNYVKIKHNSVYSTTYMHLSRFGKGIRPGVYVKQGDIVGYVGQTGLATGPHLDFRFYKNGTAVNPLRVEAPPVEPIHDNNRIPYSIVRAITMQSLKAFD